MTDVKSSLSSVFDAVEREEFGFIDVGSGKGGSLAYCEKYLSELPGVGFEINNELVEDAKMRGLNIFLGDINTLEFPYKKVSFCSFMDVLEHIPNINMAFKVIDKMASAAKDYLFIRHPNFDDISYLAKLGLKLTWTHWYGHPNMMTLADFISFFYSRGWSYGIVPKKPITHSDHPAVIPIEAPRDTVSYLDLSGFEKPAMSFEKPIYEQYDIFVQLNPEMDPQEWSDLFTRKLP